MARQSAERLAATERVFAETGEPGEPLTTSEVADALALTRRATYERLSDLADSGVIATKKVGARGRVWWRPGGGDEPTVGPESILDDHPDLVYTYDTDGRLQQWNDRVPEVTGYPPSELAGKPIEEFVTPAGREDLHAVVDRLLDAGGTNTMGVSLLTADGETLPYELTGTPITDGEGTVTGIAGVGRDVSERVARSRQLRRERDFGDQLIEATPASILVFARDGTVIRANERALHRLGIEDEEEPTVGPDELDYYDANDQPIPPAERPITRAFITGEAVTNVHCQIDLPGEGRQWLSMDAIPLGDAEPVERVLVAARDITELKHRAEQLERERATLETELEEVFARVDDGFIALDHELRYTFVNDRAEAIMETDARELLGRPLVDAFPEIEESQYLERFERALETQSPLSFEAFYEAIDSWLEVTAYPSESGLSVYFRDVTERKEREQALQEHRERLAALHNLNAVVREINEAVLRQSTRADIESLVCERLAATDSYEFAWIGEGDAAARSVDIRVEAGVDGYVDDIELNTATDESVGPGPTGRALVLGETQVIPDVRTDARFAPWQEYADVYGYSAMAAIPITHEDTTYGVLAIYADRTGAFTDEERAVVSHLGEVVGHAIAAVERKRALMSDELLELEVTVPDALSDVPLDVGEDTRITFDQTVPTGDGEYVVYGTTTGEDLDTLRDLAATLDHWESVTELYAGEDGVRYELGLSEPPVISAVAAHGGSVAAAAIEDGEYHIVVHLPADVDVREFVDVLRDAAPSVTVVARRQVSRDRSPEAVATDMATALTDRQRAALEASYHAGYFDWPRAQDGNEVASTLGVSPPTFHQHLRTAQRKLLDALL